MSYRHLGECTTQAAKIVESILTAHPTHGLSTQLLFQQAHTVFPVEGSLNPSERDHRPKQRPPFNHVPYPEHALHSVRYLKRVVLPELVARGHVEKVFLKRGTDAGNRVDLLLSSHDGHTETLAGEIQKSEEWRWRYIPEGSPRRVPQVSDPIAKLAKGKWDYQKGEAADVHAAGDRQKALDGLRQKPSFSTYSPGLPMRNGTTPILKTIPRPAGAEMEPERATRGRKRGVTEPTPVAAFSTYEMQEKERMRLNAESRISRRQAKPKRESAEQEIANWFEKFGDNSPPPSSQQGGRGEVPRRREDVGRAREAQPQKFFSEYERPASRGSNTEGLDRNERSPRRSSREDFEGRPQRQASSEYQRDPSPTFASSRSGDREERGVRSDRYEERSRREDKPEGFSRSFDRPPIISREERIPRRRQSFSETRESKPQGFSDYDAPLWKKADSPPKRRSASEGRTSAFSGGDRDIKREFAPRQQSKASFEVREGRPASRARRLDFHRTGSGAFEGHPRRERAMEERPRNRDDVSSFRGEAEGRTRRERDPDEQPTNRGDASPPRRETSSSRAGASRPKKNGKVHTPANRDWMNEWAPQVPAST